ncbi:NFX1-type zinc finger-containing protein 1-like [Carcharodon carcharias]|uniref:NFX1-type zinc finger-containing protein 1-like n=1 Tax=Carcharodon carcharias TaxID=13397 RepID=UPI001B7EA6B3|nr:NFX1-type zinc finger-containing protein 1-like [Carcharodon carcharias]
MDRKRRRPDGYYNGFGHRPNKIPRESPRGNPAPGRGGYHRQGPNFPLDLWSFLGNLENSDRQNTVLPFLLKHRDELAEILNRMELGSTEVHCVIRGLKIAAEMATSKEETRRILQLVICSVFLLRSLLHSIAVFHDCDSQIDKGALDNLIGFLRHLVLVFPENIQTHISIPVDLLSARLQRLQSLGSRFSWPVKKQLLDLVCAVNEAFPREQSGLRWGIFTQEPPKDFHHLSIFPRSEDMVGPVNPPVLPNKVTGPYESSYAYLDTHFRLLREDLVKSLREGVTACLAPRSHFVEAAGQISELKMYKNVQVLHPVCQWEGVTYKAQFDVDKFRRGASWGSRRLGKGSLVCLLAMDCEEIFFASVAKWLSPGLVSLQFSTSHAELSKHIYRHRFIMVESPAFFEAYRYVLRGLQEIDVKRVPFQRYIVKCKSSVHPPAYLQQQNISLDLLPLLRNIKDVGEAGMESDLQKDICPPVEPGPDQTLTEQQTEEQGHLTEDSFDLTEDSVSSAEMRMEEAAEEVNPLEEKVRTAEESIQRVVEGDGNMEEEHHPVAEGSSGLAGGFIDIRDQPLQPAEKTPGPALGTAGSTGRGSNPAGKSMDPGQLRCKPMGQGGTPMGQGGNLTGKNKYKVNPFKQDFRSLRWLKHFDRSQLKALQKALKREFALIQGPPGTGKSFLGLKLVELLLHNQSLWQNNDGNHSPILIVCKTKHALEQFLEGILEFKPTGIARIGGYPRNKKLQMFSLEALRRDTLQKILTPTQRRRFKELKEKIESIKEDIMYCCKILKLLPEGILHEKELEPEMKLDMKEFGLTSIPLDNMEEMVILKWLKIPSHLWPQNGTERGISHRRQEAESNRYFSYCPSDKSPSTEFNCRYRAGEDDEDEVEFDLDSSDPCDPPCNAEQWAREKFAYTTDTDTSDTDAVRIREYLADQSIMGKEEVWNIEDVWELNLDDRWRLYRKWKLAYEEKFQASLNENLCLYEKEAQDLSELIVEEDIMILKTTDVLGMTTTGAAKYRALLQKIKPRIVIMEEAAEVLEAHVLTTLTPHCQHLIMIGDYNQLKPKLMDYKLGSEYHLDVSLFERMIKNRIPCEQLSHQHRMRPEISQLLASVFYSNLKDHKSVSLYEDIKGLATNIFFIEHQMDEDNNTESLSHSNTHEAQFLAGLCQHLLRQGYTTERITILTPYMAQMWRIRSMVRELGMASISVKAVDDFQGEANDIVLLSLVRSNWEERTDLLQDQNHLCVAFSRARMGFYCVGNFQKLLQSPGRKMWEKLLQVLKEKGLVGKGLPLPCPNHPEGRIIIKSPQDFQRFRDWACDHPCDSPLECGHLCKHRCHTHTRGQRGYRCKEPCGRVLCDGGHRCPKRCWEECGPCKETVEKVLPKCGHAQMVPCGPTPEAAPCDHPCERLLECGHQCQQPCSKNCADFPCMGKCPEVLECGHPCVGTCGDCLEGRLHRGCNRKCGRLLLCGHRCKDPCADSCQPCRLPCAHRCWHGQCQKKCREACDPCLKPCPWRCRHYQCGLACFEECDRPRCDQPCDQMLPCGHPCVGLCGEACPTLCRLCHAAELTATFFGSEGDPDARFVVLEDCGHVLEVSGMDGLMAERPRPLQLETCPKCRTSIRWHSRYNMAIKRRWHGINQVKSITLGSSQEIEEKKQQLTESIIAASINLHYMEQRYDIRKKVEVSQSLPELAALERALGIFRFLDMVRKQAKACTAARQVSLELMLTRLDWWLGNRRVTFTSQQLSECRNEIARISYRADLMRLLSHCEARSVEKAGEVVKAIDPLLGKLEGKLTEEIEAKIKGDLEKIRELFPCEGLWISEDERLSVAKDIEMAKRDWYQCPNGHLYAVEECGMSADQAECLECALMIEGESQHLEEDASQAAEMDSSSTCASNA